jgi:2-(1,2-epoxy-1,2-dihydrophenyl)acetyl-CoA isomerase
VRTILSCEKPVIAAVNGPAAGAGFGLALACDVRIVASSARMTAGYVRRGLSPDAGVSWLLPRHVGLARASDILLTGRDVDAAEAERIGLAAHVVADAGFTDGVREHASRLAAGPPLAQALTKRLLVRSLDTPLDAALRDELVYIKQCFGTADVAEAISAFREKRAPTFRGE